MSRKVHDLNDQDKSSHRTHVPEFWPMRIKRESSHMSTKSCVRCWRLSREDFNLVIGFYKLHLAV